MNRKLLAVGFKTVERWKDAGRKEVDWQQIQRNLTSKRPAHQIKNTKGIQRMKGKMGRVTKGRLGYNWERKTSPTVVSACVFNYSRHQEPGPSASRHANGTCTVHLLGGQNQGEHSIICSPQCKFCLCSLSETGFCLSVPCPQTRKNSTCLLIMLIRIHPSYPAVLPCSQSPDFSQSVAPAAVLNEFSVVLLDQPHT